MREPETNKYDYGHVLILGGSEAMTGAPVLAARSALRVGAGLVTIGSTGEVVKLIDRDIEEIMTLSLPPWSRVEEVFGTIETFIKERHVSVLVMGPGLPAFADEAIRSLLSRLELPMVLDAEAFTALSGHLEVLRSAASTTIILTPHPGEYARLTKHESQYDVNAGTFALKKFAKDYDVTLVLKQHPVLVVGTEGEIHENTTGNPGLATAGAGDVLAGIVAGLLGQKINSYDATRMAVYLHGLAGDMASQANTEPGMIASDIIELLPRALKESRYLAE